MSWLLRILLGIGGALLVYSAAPLTWAAWQAVGAGSVVDQLRRNKPIPLAVGQAAVASFDRAIEADPTAQRHLDRSEVLAALTFAPNGATDEQRKQWLQTAQADLESGLAGRPGHGIGWLRLASVRLALEGPSRRVADALLKSIDLAPVVPHAWPARLELILRNWDSFNEAEIARLSDYVGMTWKASTDRRWFVWALREPLDELQVRLLLAAQPGAQEELSVWIGLVRR